jgi:glycosyltransferase involved in cell wall biosynthesis
MRHSLLDFSLLSLPGQFWKWRMQGGAVTFARLYDALPDKPDVILATDMMDLSSFRALTRHATYDIPVALYFHENQLTYPQNQRQGHGWRYGFINYMSAMAADMIYFNSDFHKASFFEELPRMLKHFGDYNELSSIDTLREKAHVLPLGLDLRRLDAYKVSGANDVPLILWNHRWEPDKNPGLFLKSLTKLADEGHNFEVAIVGENIRKSAPEFEAARKRLGSRLIRFGYVDDFADYARLLWQADYVVSASYQDFFGIAIAEAMYCNCIPILPDRLNYPYLVPPASHQTCLYKGDKLRNLLRFHLIERPTVDVAALKKHIAQYDWAMMVPRYDAALTSLVGR